MPLVRCSPRSAQLVPSCLFAVTCAMACGEEVSDPLAQSEPALVSREETGHHPAFLRKLKHPSTYRVDPRSLLPESLCGKSNLQQVNSYDGTRGVSRAYVAKHKLAVGALAESPIGDKYCSGTLIDPKLFLTAGHCVGASTIGHVVALHYEQKAGSTTLHPQEFFRVTAIVEDGTTKGLDYAILRLEEAPGKRHGINLPRAIDPLKRAPLAIIQHPGGEPKQIDAGTLAGYAGDYLTYGNIDTQPGSSGAGVLDADGRVVAVHTNGGCSSKTGTNRGVRLARVATVSAIIR